MTAQNLTLDETPETVLPRVWTVRNGSDGIGMDLFHVYAETMDEAREAAVEVSENYMFLGLMMGRFTVHAVQTGETLNPLTTLGRNVFTDRPALGFIDWDGLEVRLDTPDGLEDAHFLAEDGDGMVLLRTSEGLREFDAGVLRPRCECGNPFSLCHPEA